MEPLSELELKLIDSLANVYGEQKFYLPEGVLARLLDTINTLKTSLETSRKAVENYRQYINNMASANTNAAAQAHQNAINYEMGTDHPCKSHY